MKSKKEESSLVLQGQGSGEIQPADDQIWEPVPSHQWVVCLLELEDCNKQEIIINANNNHEK